MEELIYSEKNTMYFAYDNNEKCVAASPIEVLVQEVNNAAFYESVSGVKPTVQGGVV